MIKLNAKRRGIKKTVLQSERAECGLACIVMLAHYRGIDVTLSELRSDYNFGLTGMNLHGMMEVADSCGLRCDAYAVPVQALQNIDDPCILHWSNNHFVVLSHHRRGWYKIHDPSIGERKIGYNELVKEYAGVAINVQAVRADCTRKFDEVKSGNKLGFYKFARKVKGIRGAFIKIALIALCLEGFSLSAPLFFQMILDRAVPQLDLSLLVEIIIAYISLYIIQGMLGFARSWMVAFYGAKIQFSWIISIFEHLIKLPQEFFDRRSLGDLTSKMGSVKQIQRILSARLIDAVLDGMMASLTVIILFLYNSYFSILTLIVVTTYAGLRFSYFKKLEMANLDAIQAQADQDTLHLESLRGAQILRLYNMVDQQSERYRERLLTTLLCGLDVSKINILFGTLSFYIFSIHKILMIGGGAWMTINGHFTIGMLVAFLAYSEQFTSKAGRFIDYALELKMIRLHLYRLDDIVSAKLEANVGTWNSDVRSLQTIELREIWYRYGKNCPYVLDGVNLSLHEGESVAVVGPSGCGKSTLVKVVLGLLDPTSGDVLIDGIKLDNYGKARLRAQIGAVLQDDYLFSGSIGENISLFDTDASPEAIQYAAKQACIHDEICAMPMQYNTSIGDMGSSLSGGQKQRLLLARALYRKPRLLVLDEATSHLDTNNEEIINKNIKNMKIAKLIVAHRESTIKSADKLLYLIEPSDQK